MVRGSVLPTLPMDCRGGRACCQGGRWEEERQLENTEFQILGLNSLSKTLSVLTLLLIFTFYLKQVLRLSKKMDGMPSKKKFLLG